MTNYEITKRAIGQRVSFIRCGEMPENGISFNHADGLAERGDNGMPGVSVYLEPHKVRSEFADRKIFTGTAVVIGSGSDGEAIIDPMSIQSKNIKNIDDIKSVYEYTVAGLDCCH